MAKMSSHFLSNPSFTVAQKHMGPEQAPSSFVPVCLSLMNTLDYKWIPKAMTKKGAIRQPNFT